MRRRQNPERMAVLLARRDRHGWSWAELSRRSGLPAWKLRWWHERRKRAASLRKPGRSFVAVEIADPAPCASGPIVLTTPSGFRLEVPSDFDAGHLRRVLDALEPAC